MAQRVAYTGDAMHALTDSPLEAFEKAYARRPTVISVAPGRVNLIGEHTDYSGGLVLPVAIDRSVTVVAAPREDNKLRAFSAQFQARDDQRVDAPRRTGRREWRDYVRGVAWALLDAGYKLLGADLLIDGNVALGSGLSSSAALEVAVAGGLCAISEIELNPVRLALICQKAENQFVGVQCGIMDQLASAAGLANHALLIDCRSLEIEEVPLPFETLGIELVIVDSKLPRRLDDTPYNRRRKECSEAARILGVESLRDATIADAATLHAPLDRRTRHVVSENDRVQLAVDALRKQDASQLGELMWQSHNSLRDDFEVSCPELDLLVDLARETDGVLGSRLTGAGFGGCTVSVVRADAVDEFRNRVVDMYASKTGGKASMLLCHPSDGLRVTDV